jgi:hypothetical protein
MTMSAPPGSTARATASLTSSGAVDSTMRTPTANPLARAASSMPCKALRCPYKMVFGVRTVTDCTGPPASARAARLGRNPRASMVARTSSLVDSLTLGWPLMTRDTVWYETPAAAATSLMLTGREPRPTASARLVRGGATCVTGHNHARIVTGHNIGVKSMYVTISCL